MNSYLRLLERLEASRRLGVTLGLERVRAALAALGDPQLRLPAVHIAGTNGKGSTAAMTEALLRAAGLRTGLFTSPHLARFTERIRVDGREVSGERLGELDARIVATGVPLSYFEIATVLAFLAFAEAGVEVAVLETGLGGRLDATTACQPLATAITSIGLDHTETLGTTLGAIAAEKAGIAKPEVPLVLGAVPAEAEAVIEARARDVGAQLLRLGRELHRLASPPALPGAHQRDNAALAVALATHAAAALGKTLGSDGIAAGLASARWPGRLELVTPHVLLDGAHNAEGARALAAALPAFAGDRPVVLATSIVRGKDVAGILAPLLPLVAGVIVTRSRNDRALSVDELRREVQAVADSSSARATSDGVADATSARVTIEAVDDPQAALARARVLAGPGGLVLVAGSLFLVGELRAVLLDEPVDPLLTSDPAPTPTDPPTP